MKEYERLLRALKMEKENIIKAFEKQKGIKKCQIDFTYDGFHDFYTIRIEARNEKRPKE